MNSSGENAAQPLLAVENLRTRLLTRRGLVSVVDGVTFTVHSGQTFGIVGESGCGKSMLCKTLLRLLPRTAQVAPDADILLDGRPIQGLSEKALNRIRGKEIAMVFQNPMASLNPVMTVGAQVAEPLRRHLDMASAPARLRAAALLATVGIPLPKKSLDQFPHQMSGGMRQRVAIAMAVAAYPRLLIADEPTTALDVTVQADILDLLDHIQQERRMAMILVTHDLALVACRAHEVAVMYAGKIVERADTASLFKQPRMPYTRALLDARPRLGNPAHMPLSTINGRPPDLIRPLSGCRFAPRCPRMRKRCKLEEPVLCADAEGTHRYACWYPLGGRA